MRALLTPRALGAHLLALVCLGAAVGLGVWQLEAWQARRTAEQLDLSRADPQPLDDVLGPDQPFPNDQVGRPVLLAGTWLPDATVLVADRPGPGDDGTTPGWWVVTPLTDGGPDEPAVPVVRGWTDDLDDVPAPPTGTGELTAFLQPGEGTGATDDDPSDDVLPQLRVADLVQRVDQDLFGAYAVADADRPGRNDGSAGLQPTSVENLPTPARFTALRNLLYAVEWWIFGAFVVFIWWRWARDEVAVDDVDDGQPSEPDPVGSTP